MKPTNKCKEAFEDWLRRTQDWETYLECWDDFCSYPESMQFGVYVDFFHSVGMHVFISPYFEPIMEGCRIKNYRPEVFCKRRIYNCGSSFRNLQQARAAAIEKANQLYNEK